MQKLSKSQFVHKMLADKSIYTNPDTDYKRHVAATMWKLGKMKEFYKRRKAS